MTEPLRQSSAEAKLSAGMVHHYAGSRFLGQEEPPLLDLMNDPITRRLMDSDGVRMDQLKAVISHFRETPAVR